MNFNKFTIKSQEAVQNAQEIASSYGNQALEPEHLLAALIQDPAGTVTPIIQKTGANLAYVKIKINELLDRLPKVSGATLSQQGISQALGRVFERSLKEAQDLKDEYISTEHLLLGLVASPDSQAAKLLLDNHFNGLPVVDDKGRLIGIICQDDLIVQQKRLPLPSLFTFFDGLIPLTSYKSLEKEVDKIIASRVSQAMTPDPLTIGPEASLEDIATLMVNNNIHTLPVLEGGRLVGIIGKEDVLRTLMPPGKKD